MFEFYKKKSEKYEDVFLTNKKIIKHLIKKEVIKMSNFNNYTIPSSISDIIPSIEKTVGNEKLMINAISEILEVESFLKIDKKKLTKDCYYGNDFIVIDNIYFTNNPLSDYIETLKNKKINENEKLFSKIGYISTKELEKAKSDVKENIVNINKNITFSPLRIESIINNLIIDAIRKKASTARMYFKKGKIKADFKIGYQLSEMDIMDCDIENYINMTKYITSMFENNILFKEFSNDKYKLKLSLNKSTDDSRTIDIIDIKISNLSNKIFDMKKINIPLFDKKDFEKKCELPSGLMIISSNNNLKEYLYSMIEYQAKLKPFQKIYTIENYIERQIESVIQFEMNNDVNWKDLSISEYPIISVDEVSDKEEFNILINAISRGKFVILGVNANSSIEAFSKIHKYTDNFELLSENLLGIVHMDKVPKVCDYCSTEIEFIKNNSYQDFAIFDNAPKMNSFIKIENKNGCDNCINGYKGMLGVYEYLDNDNIIKDCFLKEFKLQTLKIEKASNSWVNIFESAVKLIKDKKTTPNAVVNSLGKPKKS